MIFSREKNKIDPEEEQKNQLILELKETTDAIDAIYKNLSYVVDQDMIDCCIFELNALQLRHKIIMNQVKQQEARACMSIKNNKKFDDI